MNGVSAYLDASQIYGSSVSQSLSLRTMIQGQMKVSTGVRTGCPYLPTTGSISNNNVEFLAGDGRVDENLALTSIHTLFVREHNRIASILASLTSKNSSYWTDEVIYQETRRIVTAVYQHIIYREYVPQVIGQDFATNFSLRPNPPNNYYTGYDPTVNAAVANEFATAAFRLHSTVSNQLSRYVNQIRTGNVSFSSINFNTTQAFL